jgi:hypothetical protein
MRAEALAELAATSLFSGELEEAGPLLEEALLTLELEEAWPALANALITRTVYLIYRRRAQEAMAVLRHALKLAEQYDRPTTALRARYNLAAMAIEGDRFAEAVDEVERGLAVARERGDRSHERRLLAQALVPRYVLGRWDEVVSTGSILMAGALDADAVFTAAVLVSVAAARGDEAMLERCRAVAADLRESAYSDQRISAEIVLARDALERGAPAEALALTRHTAEEEGVAGENVEDAYALSVAAAIAMDDEAAIADLAEMVARLPRARATPLLRAGRARLEAERAYRQGGREAAERFGAEAIGLLRSVGARPHLAETLLECARRYPNAEMVAEARHIYEQLGATRWLERIEQTSQVTA